MHSASSLVCLRRRQSIPEARRLGMSDTKGAFPPLPDVTEPQLQNRTSSSLATKREPSGPGNRTSRARYWTTRRITGDQDRLECSERTTRLPRTLMGVALASGAIGYARRLGGAAAPFPPRHFPGVWPKASQAGRHAQAGLRYQPDPEPRSGQGQPRDCRWRDRLEHLFQPGAVRSRTRADPGSRGNLDGQ
jgi:hypothetical protein